MGLKVIISGGGTGGHIFPAVAIANALRRLQPDIDILFVGAEGRMEMEKVPAAGYQIIGLDIQGFQRKSLLKNLLLPFKIISSLSKARSVIKSFKPDAAVGVGGYASGPLLYTASVLKVPYLIQEQNSYAGITNKLLAKRAEKICVAFDGMDRFFPAEKIMVTGNPVRKDSVDFEEKREEALQFFELSPDKKTILVMGGSLGAETLNKTIQAGLARIKDGGVQLIWQTGKAYYKGIIEQYGNQPKDSGIRIVEFLNRMDLAYAAADLIISRAGAGSIAELCMVAKPLILVPSPNVAEDHQTKNAMSLVTKSAALLVKDINAGKELVGQALSLINDSVKSNQLGNNLAKLALRDADEVIAREVLKIAEIKKTD